MSKQFITLDEINDAHPSPILALGVASTFIVTGSGSADLKVHSTIESGYPLLHEFRNAHTLGCHHIAVSSDSTLAVSAGFEGAIKIWDLQDFSLKGSLPGDSIENSNAWAVAVSGDGKECAISTHDGQILIWNIGVTPPNVLLKYETKGSFGCCVDMSKDGKLTASGHENGGIYIFNNELGRLLHSLIGFVKTVRDLSFSPDAKLLAVCGDFLSISLYDVRSGEQVATFGGHSSWVFSIGWNTAGNLLLSSSLDGKAKVWSLEKKECVATIAVSSAPLFKASYLPQQRNAELFVTAGDDIRFHREAAK